LIGKPNVQQTPNTSTKFSLLSNPHWFFEVVEKSAWTMTTALRLWAAKPYKQTENTALLSSYALSGLFNATRPDSFGYRHEEPDSKLTPQERRMLELFIDESDKVLVKRIWTCLTPRDSAAPAELVFYLSEQDIQPIPDCLENLLSDLSGKGCTVDCCGIEAFYKREGVVGTLAHVLQTEPALLKVYLENLSEVDTAANSLAIGLLADIRYLLLNFSASLHFDSGLPEWIEKALESRERSMARLRHGK
jgi:hypothetical protein